MKRLLALFGLLTLPLLGLAQSSILGVGMYGSSYISMASGAGGGASTYAPSSYILDGYNATGVTPSTATYVSGLTATGAKGATCTLTLTGGTTQAVGTVVLTGANVVATGAPIAFSTVGTGYVSAPTAAAVTNGTATCSGTTVVSSSLGAYTAFATDALGNLQTSMGNYASAPAACSTGQTYFNTGNSTPYYCSSTNAWSVFGGGGSNPANCTSNTATSKCLGVSPYVAVAGDYTVAVQQAITDLAASNGGTLWVPDGTYPLNGAPQDTGVAFTATTTSGSTGLTAVSSTAGLSAGFPIYGAGIPFGDVITAIGSGTLTLATPATAGASGVSMTAGGANAVITLPKTAINSTASVAIAIRGYTVPVGLGDVGGAIFTTTTNSAANLFGGYISSGAYGGFISSQVQLSNLRFRSTSSNPCMTMVNATYFATLHVDHVWVDSSASGVPTCTSGAGILFPTLSNNVSISADDLTVLGYYAQGRISEHANIGSLYGTYSHLGWVLDTESGSDPTHSTWGNSIHIGNLWEQLNDYAISAGISQTTVQIDSLDAESSPVGIVNDPNGLLLGNVNVNVPNNSGASTPYNLVSNGAGNLNICNLKTYLCSQNALGYLNPLENWISQQNSGTTIANTGSDSTNVLTTNVAWSSATGFTGNVATYNGTSSYSYSTTAASTAFDGTHPFSACAWFNVTSVSPTDQWLFNNLDSTAGAIPGWGLQIYGGASTHTLSAYINNNISGNSIFVVGPTAAVTAGAIHMACMTYSPTNGLSKAAGLTIYLDGVNEPLTVVTDTLTGSAASTIPLFVGALGSESGPGTGGYFGGALGRIRVYSTKLSSGNVAGMYAAGPGAF